MLNFIVYILHKYNYSILKILKDDFFTHIKQKNLTYVVL